MRKLIVLVGATAIAATLAACSSSAKPSGDGGTSPTSAAAAPGGGTVLAAQFVARATAATEQAQTVRLRESMSLLGAHVTASGVMRFGQKSTAASVTASTPVGPVQIVVSGGDVYVKGFGSGEPGKPWAKNPGAAQQLAAALQQADPRQTLQLLSGAGTLHRVGSEQIDGVPATHYTVTIDLAKAAKRNAQVARVLDELIKQGVRVEATQVWVDSAQRPVRISSSVQLPDPTGRASSMTSTQQVDFTDWGKPVTITVPPARQVSTR